MSTVQSQKNNKSANMKVIIAFVALAALAYAAPPSSHDADAIVVKSDFDNIGVDGYNFAYETSNGISQQEQGHIINAGTENEAVAVRGSFTYTGADGVTYTVNYVADENGFQPEGAHIPQA